MATCFNFFGGSPSRELQECGQKMHTWVPSYGQSYWTSWERHVRALSAKPLISKPPMLARLTVSQRFTCFVAPGWSVESWESVFHPSPFYIWSSFLVVEPHVSKIRWGSVSQTQTGLGRHGVVLTWGTPKSNSPSDICFPYSGRHFGQYTNQCTIFSYIFNTPFEERKQWGP